MEQARSVAAIKLLLRHYWEQIKLDWFGVSMGLLLPGIGSTLVFYVPPLIVARILGRFGAHGTFSLHQLVPYVLWFAVIWSIGELLWRIAIHFLINVETNSGQRLYDNAMDYMLNKDLSFFNNNFVGALTKKVVAYSKRYEDFLDTMAFSVTSNLVPLVFVVVVLWRFSPWLVVGLLGLMSLAVAIITPLIRRRSRLVAVRETASNVVAGHVADTITNIAAVRAFAHEEHEARIHHRNVADYLAKAKASWVYQNMRVDLVTAPLYVLINVIGLVLALAVSHGSTHALQAVFITFTYYATFTRVMWEFNRIYRNIETAITDAAQFTELLLDEPLIHDPPRPKSFHLHKGDVEFQAVNFRYQDSGGEHLFHNFNLHIAAGEKVGLVGRSGGGKTTVTKLLLRFMDVDDGQVLIDGQDIKEVRQADFRRVIAYVPQDPVMFHRSLADNIRFGKLDATEKDVKQAARLAHAAEFIEKLPQGYETLVGERGVKLSGGQRQRVAIARAMLKNAPILVLDEATSSLDSESEKLIQDALWKLMADRTAIVIAHRLSTIQKMDRIIVLDEGKIIEEGTHQQLLAKKGIYAELWAHQSGGFLNEQ